MFSEHTLSHTIGTRSQLRYVYHAYRATLCYDIHVYIVLLCQLIKMDMLMTQNGKRKFYHGYSVALQVLGIKDADVIVNIDEAMGM